MKKFLLSSIIMLGVCGAVSAQTAAKSKKTDASAASTSAAAPTPQKAAIVPSSDDVAPVTPATRTAADKEAAATAPVTPVTKKSQTTQAATTTTVNAAGVTVTSDEAKQQAVKAAEAKATGANEKKNQQ
jgi:hypothetical protein